MSDFFLSIDLDVTVWVRGHCYVEEGSTVTERQVYYIHILGVPLTDIPTLCQ